MIALCVLLAVVCAGVGLTSFQALLTWRFFRRRVNAVSRTNNAAEGRASAEPRVSILKPLCGLEDGLEENLLSFTGLDESRYEVILSVADPLDPALRIVKDVASRFPRSPFSVVVGGITPGLVANPKVERLIAASRIARGDIFFISDANVRVSPSDIEQTAALFGDPSVGCVSNVFIGEGAASLGAALESLFLLTFVLPGTVLANASGVTCVVGKSMAITREAGDRIGGFEAFAARLAEDQAIGLAVREAGSRWVLSPIVVRNVIVNRRVAQALDRQLRWGKIRYAFSKTLYAAESLTNPFPLALIAMGVSAAAAPEMMTIASTVALVVAATRCLQAGMLSRLSRARLSLKHSMLTPIQDILQFCGYFVPFFSREVNWRNHRARLGRGTVMLPSRHELKGVPHSQPSLKWGRPS